MHTLASQPSVHTCSASFVRFLVQWLDANGFDGRGLARQAGVEPVSLATPEGRVPHGQILGLWRLAAQTAHDEALGLTVARAAGPEALSLFGYSLMLGRDLAEVFQRASRDLYLLGDLFDFVVSRHGAHTDVVLAVRAGLEAPPECADAILATLLVSARRLAAAPDFAPLAVDMRRTAPRDRAPFTELFGCPPRFGQADNRLRFASADLQRPVLSAHAGLAEIYDRFVAARAKPTLADTARRHIAARLPEGVLSIEALARSLYMSTRTLHRRLASEGSSYRELVEETRKSLALDYLARGDLNLQQIALRLGFSEASNFSRAFRRWHGVSPSQYRAGRARQAA